MKTKLSRFSPLKKIALWLTVAGVVAGGYYAVTKTARTPAPKEYAEVIKQSALVSLNPSPAVAAPDLSAMLRAGITTQQGVLQAEPLMTGGIEQHQLTLNAKALPIQAVSTIDLVKAFLVGAEQVLLISYDQGGNQCSKLYQLISITNESSAITAPFGSCLPISSITESANQLIFKMPQNNPYLGADVLNTYVYQDGQISQQPVAKATELKHKYAGLSAAKILQIAHADGCYVAGVILDDNACDGGRKYCVMLQHLPQSEANQDYQTLSSFCH